MVIPRFFQGLTKYSEGNLTKHYMVQLSKKYAGSDQNTWVEGLDHVLGEYRGSTILERYIDPNDPRLNNVGFATLGLSSTMPYRQLLPVPDS